MLLLRLMVATLIIDGETIVLGRLYTVWFEMEIWDDSSISMFNIFFDMRGSSLENGDTPLDCLT